MYIRWNQNQLTRPKCHRNPKNTNNLKKKKKNRYIFYIIESMDSKTNSVVASLNLEEVLNNYNAWNYLTVG